MKNSDMEQTVVPSFQQRPVKEVKGSDLHPQSSVINTVLDLKPSVF